MSANANNKMVRLTLENCLNSGVVTVDHPRGVGSVIGVLTNATSYENSLILSNVYTTNQYVETSTQWDLLHGIFTGIGLNLNDKATVTGSIIEVSEKDYLIGYVAYDEAEKLDFEKRRK